MYMIPQKSSLLACHRDPDPDALASCLAVAEYLKKHGCKAAVRAEGTIPAHLKWLISGEDLVKDVPEGVEQVIVLDSGPEAERIGWTIPEGMPVVNLDHHASRFELNDPDNNIYVLDRCATASMLILDFDIVHPVLIAGLYGDTLFTRRFTELVECFKKLNISDELAEKYLTGIKPSRDRHVLDAIREAKARFCRNGFLIVELAEVEDPGVVEEVMRTLNSYTESVCLLQPNNAVRLRTRNPNVDVAKIAELFGGGGHKMAAGTVLGDGKRSALKSLIVSLDVEPNTAEVESEEQ